MFLLTDWRLKESIKLYFFLHCTHAVILCVNVQCERGWHERIIQMSGRSVDLRTATGGFGWMPHTVHLPTTAPVWYPGFNIGMRPHTSCRLRWSLINVVMFNLNIWSLIEIDFGIWSFMFPVVHWNVLSSV